MSQRASDIESDDDDDDDSDLDPLVGNQGIAESYPLKELSKLANNEEDERDDDDVVDDDYGYLSPGDDEESFKDEETNGFHKQARFPNGRRRRADSTIPSYTLYTPDEERRVIRKFDRRLVLFMAFLYMLSFLDRSSRFFFCLFYGYHPRCLGTKLLTIVYTDIGNVRICPNFYSNPLLMNILYGRQESQDSKKIFNSNHHNTNGF